MTGAAAGVENAAPPGDVALRLVEVVKEFRTGGTPVRAVDRLSLEVPRGQFLALVGRSGSGKSTLLHLVAGLEPPSAGEIWLDGVELGRLSDDRRTRLRRERIGMIYQFFNLLPTLTVAENVALPALLAGESEARARARAEPLLAEVELLERRDARPHTLSGGEMQRAAIARALVFGPALVMADEPTGNLDSRAADQVLALLRGLAQRHEATVLLVTHSREAADRADRVVELRDGRVVADRSGAA
ncbi:MAG TPA: ABC transporter ATP-binding protein [Candidatus Limnocylindria bacterium]|nr:ABC transporter ATP-binding protein [Candidatus Limnocylindria bacterium]